MTHEFSDDPIKVRLIDIKTGAVKTSYVFIGSVESDLERELIKLEKHYNSKRKLYNSSKIKKFYGANWKAKLGLVVGKTGGKDKAAKDEQSSALNLELPEMDMPDMPEVPEVPEFQIDDTVLDDVGIGNELQQANVVITEGDIENNVPTTKIENLFEEHEKTLAIERDGDVRFVFDTSVFPCDNVLEFKYKIYLELGIPIYRQHLWFKYKSRSYPASYNISTYKHNEYIDVETLIAFYQGEKKMDEIEGVPIDINYYKNKEYLHVSAQDTFNLLHTYYYKYGITEYSLVDLNSLIKATDLYDKLSKDRYQLEVIYYGFIVLYFPMITYTVFGDYLKNEKTLSDTYPELRPDKSALKKRFDMERSITYESYEAADNSKNILKKLFSSITDTIISIDNYKQDIEMLVVLRNVFDIIVLNDTITYCKANILHENQNVVLRKSYMNEREPRDIIPINSLLLKIKTNADTNENMRLIMFKNGNYIVKTEWREENHMTFDKIIAIVSKKVNPIIKLINSMGNRVKHHDVLIPEIDRANTVFTETGLVFYYDDDTTESKFVVFKNILEDFRRGSIINSKETMSIGQEYFFNKGMYKFDASRIEKAISLDNYYDYLSNGVVRQKWTTIFERTRLFQINNVSSKLKITINGIRNDVEMDYFHMYLIGLLNIYERNTQNIRTTTEETVNTKSLRALKNLKIQDPVLYDFKKIYKSNVIYSKICQKPYQPIMLSDSEYKQLPGGKKSNAIKYWNFTKQKPVWYSCPNARYPYIKFITKRHPKDFCIPCCKKIAMNENVNVKKQEIHSTCMKDHLYSGEKVNLTKGSHYIATYGKDIEVGRISRLPEHTLEPLFFDTYSPEGGIDQECITADGYYLFGVDQHTASVNNIGYLYCVVHALGMNVDQFIADCTARLKKSSDKFRVLLDGNAGLYFTDINDLCDGLSLLNRDTIIPNKLEAFPWNTLLQTIVYFYYGINTILFDDQQKEMIEFVLPKGLKNADEMFPSTHKNLVVLRKKVNYYPVYLLNTEIFKRTGIVDTKLFHGESGLMAIIKAVVRRHFERNDYEKIKSAIDLQIIKLFAAANSAQISIKKYFINYTNLCYAVLIEYKSNLCYVPIYASHYSLEKDVELIFEPYSDGFETKFSVLDGLFRMYNRWVGAEAKKAGMNGVNIYPLIEVEHWLEYRKSGEVVGFVNGNVNYYCAKMSVANAKSYYNMPMQIILYDPATVNRLIYSVKSGKQKIGKDVDLVQKMHKSMYNYYLYQLCILQFIALFNAQRNTALRRKLVQVLAKTNFDKNMDALKDFIKSIDDLEDIAKLKNIIGRFITIHHNKRKMIEDIHNTYFNFDRVELEKLKKLDYKTVLKRLTAMSAKIMKIGDVSKLKKFEFPNLLISCGQMRKGERIDYCDGNKLIIRKDQIDNILDILAHDIINPIKWKWLFNSAFVEKSVDFFKFIRRPTETITVEFI